MTWDPRDTDPLHVPDEPAPRQTSAELSAMSDAEFAEWVRSQGFTTDPPVRHWSEGITPREADPYTDYHYGWRNGWRWVGWFLRNRRPVAAIRQAFWVYVRGYISETCERCGRPYFLWHAPDDLWSRVTGHPQREGDIAAGLYCPACFDRQAERLGIVLQWRPEVFIER